MPPLYCVQRKRWIEDTVPSCHRLWGQTSPQNHPSLGLVSKAGDKNLAVLSGGKSSLFMSCTAVSPDWMKKHWDPEPQTKHTSARTSPCIEQPRKETSRGLREVQETRAEQSIGQSSTMQLPLYVCQRSAVQGVSPVWSRPVCQDAGLWLDSSVLPCSMMVPGLVLCLVTVR